MNLTFDCRAKRNGKTSVAAPMGVAGRQTDTHTNTNRHTHTHTQYTYVQAFWPLWEYLIDENPKQKELKRQSAAGCRRGGKGRSRGLSA